MREESRLPSGRQAPSSPPGRLLAILALFLGALAVLAAADAWPTPRPLRGDELRYQAEAVRISHGDLPPPDFVWPPLQSYLLGAVFALAGPSLAMVKALQAGFLLAAALLLRSLLSRAGLSPLAADLSAAFLLLDPQVASFALYLWPETAHLLLLLGAVALLTDPDRGPRALVAGGALLGLALLAKSLVGPFVPVLLAAAALSIDGPRDRRLLRAGTAAAGLLAVVLPVVVRNGVRWGTFSIANSGPFNVWVGLNDPSGRRGYDTFVAPAMNEYLASSPVPAERNRIVTEKIAAKLSRDGLLPTLAAQVRKQYVRLLDRESYFTDQLAGGQSTRRPGAPGRREGLLRAWAYGTYGAALALAGFGIFLAMRNGPRGWQLPALFLAYNASLFLLLHVKTRYRIAFWPAILFFSAVALDHLVRRQRPAGWQIAGGAAAAALLLGLAFGG